MYIRLALLFCLTLTSCSVDYVIRAAYEEGKILWAREDIARILEDPKTDPETKRKLELVLEARAFTKTLSLSPDQSFTTYSEIDKDVLVWVLAGCKPTAFQLHTWWFPFVGRVPYKGFFDKEDAEQAGRDLENKGYEISIRGAEALSTLGWFNDPVLSTTLQHPDEWIVNTVIHETLHSTVWIKDNVAFNESLANFVGLEGTIRFYESRGDARWLRVAQARRDMEFELGRVLDSMYRELEELYNSEASDEVKLDLRQKVFERHARPLRNTFSNLKVLAELNNAELMQLKFYLTSLDKFNNSFISLGRDWPKFIEKIREIGNKLDGGSVNDPFELLSHPENSVSKPD